ncbi:chemotaxis protein CheW [Shewanella sairae]|uniref:Chemotaxis protein CheW n=1 Tax=Shewanella sairae TaxID=190310 RepID=A0ABQ4PPJ0_9GAMM|nr:chemotaxis protein CheW [Shewanella sairae]MCL1131429.1 chemotaxis protein CheW [Shewanella sairae]GIU50668.1 chemotaxis protein CheW [Shewanella sairae]
MSKLVDDAVCDYFSLLLSEPVNQQSASKNSLTLATLNIDELTRKTDEKLTRQSLEELFANSARNKQQPEYEVVQAIKSDIVVASDSQIPSEADVDTSQINTSHSASTSINEQAMIVAEVTSEKQSHTSVSQEGDLVSTQTLLERLDEEFQVLFFKVAGLTLAVPLVSLGGIINLEKLTPLIGRPKWYMGAQQHRGSQLNVVDTCAWVMPEKYTNALAEQVTYQYVVALENSQWGLSCEALVDTITVKKSEVNWRNHAGKRPWLAGVVKKQMCGILNVDALIQMLSAGLGYQDTIPEQPR